MKPAEVNAIRSLPPAQLFSRNVPHRRLNCTLISNKRYLFFRQLNALDNRG